jgi:hypothetical protein
MSVQDGRALGVPLPVAVTGPNESERGAGKEASMPAHVSAARQFQGTYAIVGYCSHGAPSLA